MIFSMTSSRIIIKKCDYILNLRKSCLPLTYIKLISTTNQIFKDEEESKSRDLQVIKKTGESKVEVKKPTRRSLLFSEEKPLCPYTGIFEYVVQYNHHHLVIFWFFTKLFIFLTIRKKKICNSRRSRIMAR